MAIKPFRADSGVQMATGSASWQGPSGVAGIYYKTGVGVVARNVDNSETTLGAAGGGGITGSLTSGRLPVATGTGTVANSQFTAAGNTLDLSGSGAAGLFTGANTTSLLVGGVNTLLANVQCTGLRVTQAVQSGVTATSAFRVSGAAATNMTASTEYLACNFNLNQVYEFATGNFSTQRHVYFQAPTYAFVGASTISSAATVAISGGPNSGTNATITNAYALWLQGGDMGVFPAFRLRSSSQGATNTIGMTLQPNVADGASTVGVRINSSTTLANATASLFQIANNNTNLLNARINSTDGVKLVDGGGSSALSLSTAAGASLAYGTAACSVNAGVIGWSDGTGTFSMTSGNAVFAGNQILPDADGTRDFGLVGTRWRTLAGKRILRGTQLVAFSATPALDPTTCNVIHFGPVTANVTAPTLVAGAAGETCTIVWLKDGTAGTFTIGGWGANVRFNGNATFAAGANAIIVQQFTWDDRLGVPAWVLTSTQPVV